MADGRLQGPDPRRSELASGFVIRTETPGDRPAVSSVLAAAFGSPEVARLVEAIRDSPQFVPDLSLVAEVGGQIVGHVMISYAAIRHDGIESPIALLSPLGVAPQWQKRGVGSELVGRVTRLAEERGEPVVVLEGAPAFYGRLGFEFSVPYGIHISLPSWAPPEASQVLRLTGYTGAPRGLVVLPPAFDAVTER